MVKSWFRGWDVGRRYGPTLVFSSAIGFALVAWQGEPVPRSPLVLDSEGWSHDLIIYRGVATPGVSLYAAASAFLALVVPFTQFVVFPIDEELLAENERVIAAEKARDGNNKGFSLETTRD